MQSSGFRYKGEWANSLPDGKGRATYPDGGVYEGTFRKGKRDGRGTLHFPGGATYTGTLRYILCIQWYRILVMVLVDYFIHRTLER